MGRVTYVLVVGLLEADVEEPEVFVELDFGGHGGWDRRPLGFFYCQVNTGQWQMWYF